VSWWSRTRSPPDGAAATRAG